jgi:hypothetical protein
MHRNKPVSIRRSGAVRIATGYGKHVLVILENIQRGSEAHTASYSIGPVQWVPRFFPGAEVAYG